VLSTDANLLLYAYDEGSAHFGAARAWLEKGLNSPEPFGIPMQSILAFLRIGTSQGLRNPYSLPEALEIVDSWLERPQVQILSPGPNHWPIFRQLCIEVSASGRLTTDVHLAALAIEHGARFCSNDQDFARFKGLDWHNPLAQQP
jgi:uncharacterized protein